jgi:hypothetical protein
MVGCLAVLSAPGASAATQSTETVTIVMAENAPRIEALAAGELASGLGHLHPAVRFVVERLLPERGPAILLGSVPTNPSLREALGKTKLDTPESFLITTFKRGDRQLAAVVGADPPGTYYGACRLLEHLGYVFCLSYEGRPAASPDAFSYENWYWSDAPLVRHRIVFNWHNFLSGCSSWNLPDWQKWTAQSQKMGFNTIMVHAYGNNPMFTFHHNGVTKEVGYLPTTRIGRDWGNPHVNDVRRLPGGYLFDGAEFGADAAKVSGDERIAAAQSLMKGVFAAAAGRGMHVCFALDVDTTSSQPQEILRTLPDDTRFEVPLPEKKGARLWICNPDTPAGYAYYKAQIEALLTLYPQIDRLAFWIRNKGTPWLELQTADFPRAWQREYEAELARTPQVARLPQAPGRFALAKVMAAMQRAVQEIAPNKIELMAGSWGFDWLEGSDRFFPKELTFVPLDYQVIHGQSDIDAPASRALLQKISAHRPVVPIAWAQHDDGHYVGRPYTPPANFQQKLSEAHAAGFGIIHWMTRPLDLYFKSLARQVWKSTADEPLETTCRFVAAGTCGPSKADLVGGYLQQWLTTGPMFGRETTDAFIDRPFSAETVQEVLTGCRRRLALIELRNETMDPVLHLQLEYFRGMEQFCAEFYDAQGLYQISLEAAAHGDLARARAAIAQCHPEKVIDGYAHTAMHNGITRGEQGVLIAMALNWVPFVEAQRQAVGLTPARYCFGPTLHEPQAQGAGKFTFYADPLHRLWRCLGPRETGTTLFTINQSGLSPAVDSTLVELGRRGLESDHPLKLALRPITFDVKPLGDISPYNLAPGRYRVRLYLVEPQVVNKGERVFDITVSSDGVAPEAQPKPDRVDLIERVGKPHEVVELDYEVTVGTSGQIDLTLTPVHGSAVISAVIVQPLP